MAPKAKRPSIDEPRTSASRDRVARSGSGQTGTPAAGGLQVPLCDMGFGRLSCLMNFSQPCGFRRGDDLEALDAAEGGLPCCLSNAERESTVEQRRDEADAERLDVDATPESLDAPLGGEGRGSSDATLAAAAQSRGSSDEESGHATGSRDAKGRKGATAFPLEQARRGKGRFARGLTSALVDGGDRLDSRPPQDFDPVAALVKSGRWVEADKALKDLENSGQDPHRGFSASLVERIHRLGARYNESLREIDVEDNPEAWTKEHDQKLDLHYAYRLSSNSFQAVCQETYRGFDALQAFVALCEYDLSSAACHDVYAAELVDGVPDRVNDSIWRVRKSAHAGTEDNILHVSCLDALSDQNNCLWLSAYTVDEARLEELPALGARIPPPEDGAVRVGLWRSVFVVTPMASQAAIGSDSGDDAAHHGFKLTVGICRRPTSAACVFPGVAVRREVGGVMQRFRRYLQDSTELNWRTLFSRKADFYASVRRRLAAMPGARPQASPLLKLKFEEISRFLPEDWADDAEGLTVCPGGQCSEFDGASPMIGI